MRRSSMSRRATVLLGALALASVAAPAQGAGDSILTVDHYVRLKSTAPAMNGQLANVYLRERTTPEAVLRGNLTNRVVLFIHGAGTPAETAFDAPYADYSWMAYLADAGFDVFAMDQTGYGRSTRPSPMDDPCNLSPDQRTAVFRSAKAPDCTGQYTKDITTLASDWDDIEAVVDYIRTLRHVDRLSLVAWSLGGARAGGYAAKHPDKVDRMVLLAPVYGAGATPSAPFGTQSKTEFRVNWDRQVGCTNQYDPKAADAVWSAIQESDPVGATWADGVRRAPNVRRAEWNAAAVAAISTPTLLISGIYDKQVEPALVRQYHAGLGATEKVFIDLGCSSHNAMWENNRLLLFDASRQWLANGNINGQKTGSLRLGYDPAALQRTN